MQCFMCHQQIVPEKGYFKTQLWNGKLACHERCKPKFYWDNKPPEKDEFQAELFEKQDEKAIQPSHS